MKTRVLILGALLTCVACSDDAVNTVSGTTEGEDLARASNSQTISSPEEMCTLAFPGAMGFGRCSQGGRGGEVYHVTSLADSGPGTLRAAIDAEGPRTVIFDVSGTISLDSPLTITNDYITIAGQTAPGDGITLRGNSLRINANHVIVRYLRSRIGDETDVEDDAVSLIGGSNIILDHISASWAIDEVLSASQRFTGAPGQKQLTDITIQWSIISEGLYEAGHEKGNRAYGSLIRGNAGARYSWIGNLWATHHSRMPRIGNYQTPYDDPEGILFDFRNNVMYNWGHGAETDFWNWVPASADFDPSTQLGLNQPPLYGREGTDYHFAAGTDLDPASVAYYNFVNNAYVQGPETLGPVIFYMRNTMGRAYFAGNTMDGELGDQTPMLRSAAHDLSWVQEPFDVGEVPTLSAQDAFAAVLAHAGASRVRDSVDERVMNDVVNRTGRVISSPSEVGGWPELNSLPAPEDTDRDGLPDAWEIEHNFDPADPSDARIDGDGDGYTRLEDYLNALAGQADE